MAPDPDDLLAGLDDDQRVAVTHPTLPLLVVAGAGSGKTKILTRRIAWRCATGVDDPRRVLALTFTRAAASELTARLRALGLRDGVRAGTFHAIAWAELRTLRAERRRPVPVLLDRPTRVLARLVPDGTGGDGVREAATEIAWARARRIAPEDYPAAAARAGRRSSLPPATIAEVAHRYAEEKRRRGLVDFDDLLEELAAAIENDAVVAAAQRWRTAHLYVDEYQDLNPLQDALLRAWLGDQQAQVRDHAGGLCAVGDPNQAIYGWNGADPTLLDRFVERHPGAAVIAVDRSYRSTPEILAVANALLDAGGCGGVRLRPVRADGAVPVVAGYDDDVAEARAVARACLDLRLPGKPWSQQAVLARTHAQLEVIESALAAVGIPVRAHGRCPFVDLPAVQGTLRELAAAPDLAAALARLSDGADLDPDVLRLLELAEAYRIEESKPTASGLRAYVVANADESARVDDGVDLRTFHAAKGLEWPIVHVAGVEDGFVPIAGARSPDGSAEERRLLYVALTRAESVLRVTWAAARRFQNGDEPVPRRPSPYLAEIWPAVERLRTESAPADWRHHLPAVRVGGVERQSAPAAARAEVLQAWRRRRARAAGVAPGVVLPDHALAALAANGAASLADVASVSGTSHLLAAGLVDDLLSALEEHVP